MTSGHYCPYAIVKKHGTHHQGYTNSHRFLLRDSVWSLPGVKDITGSLKKAERPAGGK